MIKYLRKRKFWREIKYLKFFKNNQRKQMCCRKKCREKRNKGAGQQAGIKKIMQRLILYNARFALPLPYN